MEPNRLSVAASPIPLPAVATLLPRVRRLRTRSEPVRLGAGTPVFSATLTPAAASPVVPRSDRFPPASAASLAAAGGQIILQRGNAQFSTDGQDAKKAARFWLRAYDLPQRDVLRHVLQVAAGAQSAGEGRALSLMHLAFLQPDARAARGSFFAATDMFAGIGRAMSCVLSEASKNEAYAALYATLYPRFVALRPVLEPLQNKLMRGWELVDDEGMVEAAQTLESHFPFLLAPKCALLVSAITQHVKADRPAAEQEILTQATDELLAFVYHLDAEEQQNAQGLFDESVHRGFWSDALDAAYRLEPSAFHAASVEGAPQEERLVMGLPWEEALRLPLSRSWAQEVAARQTVSAPRRRARRISFFV